MRETDGVSALISPLDLADLQSDPSLVVLDVQYNLVGTPGQDLYAAAHLPGAHFLSLDDALAGPPGAGGRHPLPAPEVLAAALRACGVSDDSHVVVYDQQTSLSAARAWWILRWAGMRAVRVLNSGLAAWRSAGLPVTDVVPPACVGTVVVATGAIPHLDAQEAAAYGQAGRLLDVRAPERYRGEVEPIDAVAGHIPGAVNLPASQVQNTDGTFRSPEEIRAVLESVTAAQDEPWGTSCGSGVTAAQVTLALHEAGIESLPYIGSWSGWITDPSRPIATGLA